MKLFRILALVLVANLCLAFSAYAEPTIYTIVLDASVSIDPSDFQEENSAAAALIVAIHAASQVDENQGKLADFMSVAWFGGKDDYIQLPYFNASDISTVSVLATSLSDVRHPKFQNTALYSALAKATIQALTQERDLGGTYNQVILLVTDGAENQSPYEMQQLVKEVYPNNKIFLAVIGVGGSADVSDFKKLADDVRHIDDFAELAAVFTVISGMYR
ncbi:MAG: vWA domain-containing protein [Pseudomonadota bacterium]